MADPIVSIVTPVYNGGEYLTECIESVLSQTCRDWEYVIMDNCSDDRTREVAEQFAAADERIRYERQAEFVDMVANHNRAFRAISPESRYCKVVQADDWLYSECLERMLDLAESSPNVGVVGAYRLAGDTVDLVGVPYWKSVVPGTEILRQSLLGGPYVTGSPTSVLLRSELIREREPFYDPSFRHADTEAAYWALTRSDFGVVHQVLTFSRQRPDGETPVSLRVNSYYPENLRMLIRYGPGVLSEAEYRRQLRVELRRYVWWQAKQTLRPSRLRDKEFQTYQRSAVDKIAAEAAGDTEVLSGDGRHPVPSSSAGPTPSLTGIDLNAEGVRSRRHTRLERIEHLLRAGRLTNRASGRNRV